jgi:RNA recognition motif-containing protein
LSIPTPYAFNYHVDAAGAFRGLAFANFRLAADADAVVAALNGFDVQGRKLRVEYKKVLQAGEKERIEREKAIRRMRSMQMEKERAATAQGNAGDWEDYGQVQSTQQYQGANPVPIGMGIPVNNGGGYGISGGNGNVMQSPGRSYSGGGMNQLPSPTLSGVPPVPAIPQQYYQMPRQTSQHQPPMLHVTTPPPDPYGHHLRSFSPPAASRTSPPPMVHRQESQHQQNLLEPVVSIPSKNYNELDMNDPSTLEIYSRVLLFKDDRMRDEMAFSRSLSAMERRVVHMVAKKLGLYHRSVGEGSERYAVVMRYPPDNARVS